MTVEALRRRLADGEVVLLDGGTGTELEASGVPMDGAVWSALAVLEPRRRRARRARGLHPRRRRDRDRQHVRRQPARARAGRARRPRRGDQSPCRQAAVQARESAAERPVLVAGSLTPLGTEIVPDAGADREHVLACFREQAEVQAQAGADLFAIEMVPDGAARGRRRAGRARDRPAGAARLSTAWSDGDAAPPRASSPPSSPGRACWRSPRCTARSPRSMRRSTRSSAAGPGRSAPTRTTAAGSRRTGSSTRSTPSASPRPPPAGSRAARSSIGGCCGIGPAHIARLREQLPSHVPAEARRRRLIAPAVTR